jgi:probable HAF family extracellular repeat protein
MFNYGFLYNRQDGTYTTIDEPLAGPRGSIGHIGTFAQGINDVGQVVGYYTGLDNFTNPTSGTYGFLYSGGTFTTLNDPLANPRGTFAFDINNAGLIVGYNLVGSVNHGFVYDGSYTTLDDPLGINGTQLLGINNTGQIVGSYIDASSHSHGFLYNGSAFTTLDDPAGTDTVATGINDLGQIVGHYSNGSVQHSFLYS